MSPMVASRAARGSERGLWLVRELGAELRAARLAAGLTVRTVARLAGISPSELSRIERGRAPWLSIELAARLCSIVGLDLWLRSFPRGDPARDAAQAKLAAAFRRCLSPSVAVKSEVPVGPLGDLRAWDHVIAVSEERAGVELGSRLHDAQSLTRRIHLKLRDSGIDRAILVLRDTRANRSAYEAARATIEPLLPLASRVVARALAEGRIPPAGGVLFL